jgi:hypothetical protein
VSDTTKTQPVFQLTPQQQAMAIRNGAVICVECGRPTWMRTGNVCDPCVQWAARHLHGPSHVPGETAAQRACRTGRLDGITGRE